MNLFNVISLLGIACVSALPYQNDYDTRVNIAEFQRPYDQPPAKYAFDKLEAQILESMLPQSFSQQVVKMDKNQKIAAVKLAKSVLKPLIKSQEFRNMIKMLEEMMVTLRDEPEVKTYLREAIDSLQEIYERTDSKVVKDILTWFVAQYSDEETARSITSIWSDISPSLESWFFGPFRKYYRTYLNPTINNFREKLADYLGEDISANAIARSAKWSDFLDPYIERVADMSMSARSMLEATANFLEMQDKAIETS